MIVDNIVHDLTIGMTVHQLARHDRRAFEEKFCHDPLTWLPWNVRFPQTWEAKSFDFKKAPHVKGFIERFWNDPTKKKANLCWATRLCKTTTLLSLICWIAENKPAPMAILFPGKDYLDKALEEHIYPMFERTPSIRRQLLPKHLRNRHSIALEFCRIRLANSGTKTSVSGYPALFIFKFEHDKNDDIKSSEAAATYTIESRCSGYPRGAKIVEEGTPCEEDLSYAAKLLRDPTVQNVHYWVPCPHCNEFQKLKLKNLRWKQDERKQDNPTLASKTAWYECDNKCCKEPIRDDHREVMMQRGVWLIDGEYADAEGNICGEPDVDSNTMIFGPLSKLYSLFVGGWGTVAEEYIIALAALQDGDQGPMKKFMTETMGEPYVPRAYTATTSALASHMRGEYVRGELPEQTCFITTSADAGLAGNTLLFHWQTHAWWPVRREFDGQVKWIPQGAIIDWQTILGEENFVEFVNSKSFKIRGNPRSSIRLKDFLVGIDTGKYGDRLHPVADMLENGVSMKGDSRTGSNVSRDLYYWGNRKTGQDPEVLKAMKALDMGDLLFINSDATQEYRVAVVSMGLKPGYRGFLYMPMDICDSYEANEPYFDQLRSDIKVKSKWEKTGPNEGGDGVRYNWALANKYTRGGTQWEYVSLSPECLGVQPTATEAATHYSVEPSGFSEGYVASQR